MRRRSCSTSAPSCRPNSRKVDAEWDVASEQEDDEVCVKIDLNRTNSQEQIDEVKAELKPHNAFDLKIIDTAIYYVSVSGDG